MKMKAKESFYFHEKDGREQYAAAGSEFEVADADFAKLLEKKGHAEIVGAASEGPDVAKQPKKKVANEIEQDQA